MIFARYTFCRFTWYFIGIALFLAALFNLIEFFEKLMRNSLSSIDKVAHFVMLHFGPSFAEHLPIASSLAVLLLLKEFHQRNELDFFPLLMISKKALCRILFACGVIASLFSFIVNECIMIPLSTQAERFRAETFKKKQTNNICNKSMWLPNRTFASIGFINTTNNTGTDLTLIQLSPTYVIENIKKLQRFTLANQTNEVQIQEGVQFECTNHTTTSLANTAITIPTLFTHLVLFNTIPVLSSLITTLILYRNLLSHEAYTDTFHQLLTRLLFYFYIMVAPLLTVVCFFLAEPLGIWRWFFLILPHGLFLIINALIIPICNIENSIWILLTILGIILISIKIIWQKDLLA